MAEKKEPQTFEEAMVRIEVLASRMESRDIPLEDLLVAYEEGLRLVKYCNERLSHAEKRLHAITRNAAGEAVCVAPVEVATGPSTGPESSVTEKDAGGPGKQPGSVRLF